MNDFYVPCARLVEDGRHHFSLENVIDALVHGDARAERLGEVEHRIEDVLVEHGHGEHVAALFISKI